ncbi:hypothetical protein Droror1_Dr00007123 [Drosera rotundifolia]
MESSIDILIVGAGVSGLTAALALHRQGIKSMVLELSNSMRASGFHLSFWTNAWKAFEEIGVADKLRQQHEKIPEMMFASMVSGLPTSLTSLETKASNCNHEVRRVLRRDLLGALEKELPRGTIRYSSKVVSIEESGYYKLVHLADGTTLKAKVLIGCDGVNSVVAKWLGFKKPALDGRSEIKGSSYIDDGHALGLSFQHFFGKGVSFGVMPGDDKCIYWFFTFTQSQKDGLIEEDRAKMKQFVLRNIGRVPEQIVNVIESTKLEDIEMYPLTFRPPLEILWGNISKDNVCVAGDAWHPMTPDVGQGGGSAVEDGITLAKCLAEALSMTETDGSLSYQLDNKGYERIRVGLSNYAKERRWRNFGLAVSAYLMAIIVDSEGMVLNFLRDKVLASYLGSLFLKRADFDCGKLKICSFQAKPETEGKN